MRLAREDLFRLIEPLLPLVEKPSRYLDHEWGAVEEQPGPFHACLVYPDAYEVGQPNLGISILYDALNGADGISCSRCLRRGSFSSMRGPERGLSSSSGALPFWPLRPSRWCRI